MTKHECKYWYVNIKYHYRQCNFCRRVEYDYGGKWKGEIKLEYFIEKYSHKTEQFDVFIHSGSFFEYNAYESWGAKIMVQLNVGNEALMYGPFPNLNAAEYGIDESRRKEQEKAGVDGSRIRNSETI